jgi:hypothetical protein
LETGDSHSRWMTVDGHDGSMMMSDQKLRRDIEEMS